MKTTDLINVPNLPRRDNDPSIERYLGDLVRKYHVMIELVDYPDDEGNCVIRATHGDESILDALISEVRLRA